ncbi:MAG TPA: hypothetical protein VHY59_08460, partial [Chthoniobacterales bacterium]|nr:hypothetical protein [Chthoniobacterales bacterium]
MAKVIKSVDGKFYSGEFEEMTPEQVSELVARKQTELQDLEAIAPANEAAPAAPETPAPAAPAD